MENIIDYVKEWGKYSFAEKPFNEVDSLALCQITTSSSWVPWNLYRALRKVMCLCAFKAFMCIRIGIESWMITGIGRTTRSFLHQ